MQQHRASVGKIEPYWQSRKASMVPQQKPAAMGPYLEQISSQATVMHTVLTTLCNGLERLEKRMDDNDAGWQSKAKALEDKIENIAFHISGEDTTSGLERWQASAPLLNNENMPPASLDVSK
jgi:hypothetical protein